MPVHTSSFFTLELHLIALHNQIENIKSEYKKKEFDLGWNYKKQIKKLEKENNHLHKIIDKFYETVDKFIKCICHEFEIGESKELIKYIFYLIVSSVLSIGSTFVVSICFL